MTKNEFIKRYGEEKYLKWRIQTSEWDRKHRKTNRRWFKDEKEKRANMLINNYINLDKKYNRGECTLTVEQIIKLWENGCCWCGEKDWHSLGVDRIDNSKPHTIDNVVCSCRNCNVKRGRTKRILQYTKDGEFIKEWESASEIVKELGYNKCNIQKCCRGEYGCKTLKGYIWKYK